MKTMKQLLVRQQISQAIHATPEKTGQYSQRGTAGPQLSGRHLQQTDLAAMGIEQNKTLQPHRRQLPAHLVDQIQKQRRREAEGAWKVLVLRRKADGLTRQSPNRQSWIETTQHGIEDAFSEKSVRRQRQMGAVLLTGSKRPNHRGTGLGGCTAGLGPCQLIKSLVEPVHGVVRA